MTHVDTFCLDDRFGWSRSRILREALECAKRNSEVAWYVAVAVAITDVRKIKSNEVWYNRYDIKVYGHELEVPELFKASFADPLMDNIDRLTTGDGWVDET